jgi:STE24 endopeptidase
MTATRMVAATIAVAVWAAAAILLWRTEVPPGLELPALTAEEEFAPAQLRESAGYVRVIRGLWVGSTVSQLLLLAGLAVAGPRLAGRLGGGRLLRGLGVLAIVLVALWAVRLPFGAVAHWWRRRHGLSDQPYLDWLVDPWPELLAGTLTAAVALTAGMLLARRLGGRWWLAGGPALAVVGAVVVLAQPLVQSPRLEPLDDEDLAAEILALAAGMGVEAFGVDVKDASRRTTRLNAQVIGTGATRRVVLWDTLLDGRATPAEVRFVVAHELAHVERAHTRKGVAWFALLAVPLTWILAALTQRRGGLAEPGVVPLAVLVVVALQLAVLPLTNAISRRYEAEADWLALRATGEPAAARAIFHRFVEENLAQPDPPRWARIVYGTHPPLIERIAMAEAFARDAATRRRDAAPPGGS